MKTIFKTLIILTLLIFISACSSLSSLPFVGSNSESQPDEGTPQAQANDQGEDEAGYNSDDLFEPNCHDAELLVTVRYDHRWIWSPDGTENTGNYIGTTKGKHDFWLSNDGYGNFDSETSTIFYEQEGIIHRDSDKCDVNGKGMAEMTLYGTCLNGVIGLEWIEIDTGESEATITCDGKETPFSTFYPLQSVFTFELPDDGLGYRQSNDTAVPLFRNVSMEWTISAVPRNQQ